MYTRRAVKKIKLLKQCGRSNARLCDFEDAQQPGTSQHADADWLHQLVLDEHKLHPAAYNDEEVEAVEH